MNEDVLAMTIPHEFPEPFDSVTGFYSAIAFPSIANTAIAAERHISGKLSKAMFS
ncbi:hypothetical protein HFO26_35465 [Rhizobium leguminosarum]|uniref:hypothetical protein n=1 Tax=Rhizobium leguminosarum TaxID=384 RepID=UPI001C97E5A5|nr:hypothetical protein [Rhizobium leguminosarum]MBY5735478.1 hypothetical protein [Rhizobium leguminosarum]